MSLKETELNKIVILSPGVSYPLSPIWYEITTESHFWIKWRLMSFLQLINHLNISTQDTLRGVEIGCGTGVFLSQIEKNTSWIVDGVELNLEVLRRNQNKRRNLFLYNVMEQHKDFKEKYDFLILFDVLEHVDKTHEFLQACLYHIKPGGYLFINVPALQCFFTAYDTASRHFRRYNKKTLSQELNHTNIEILNIRYWGVFLLPLLFLRKFIISSHQSHDDIIRKSFKPPNQMINSFFSMFIEWELAFFKNPILGASLLTVARKSHKA